LRNNPTPFHRVVYWRRVGVTTNQGAAVYKPPVYQVGDFKSPLLEAEVFPRASSR
jgi:hypothetical protein